MKKAKGNKKLASLPLLVLVLSLVFSGTGLFSAIYAAFTIATQSFVSQTYSYSWKDEKQVTHNESVRFDCYPINSGYSGSHPGIAVAWHDETGAARNTPDYLEVPFNLTDSGGAAYDVVAVVKGGFRYCDFKTLSLPKQVEEIGEEAFAYCESLTKFVLPYGCDAVSPSMLMDCRNLETFSYQTEDGAETTASAKVKRVGDHAFLKCVKLRGFNSPSSLVYIGDGAFENCSSLTTIFLPKTDETVPGDVPAAERIHIGNYAFADCKLLTMFFFDVNVWSVGEYVFARCVKPKLSLYYTGSNTTFENPTVMTEVSAHWRDVNTAMGLTDKHEFTGGHGKFDYDHTDNCPGLFFTIENNIGDLMLDQSKLKTDKTKSWQAKMFRVLGYSYFTTTATDIYQDKNEVPTDFERDGNVVYQYASIIQFVPPSPSDFVNVDNPYYREYETGKWELTIPDVVKGDDGKLYPVRVIETKVFQKRTELTKVTFSKYLVQIRQQAFLGCKNIATLDFGHCDDLLEVSYEVFQGNNNDNTANTALHRLALPNCLKYIGKRAFCNFRMVNEFEMGNKVVFIGEGAFENLGTAIGVPGTVDLTLPNTLRDGPVDQNSPTYGFKIERYGSGWDEAIQPAAFKNAKCLRSVKIAESSSDVMSKISNNGQPKDHNTQKPYRIGIQVDAFNGCSSMVRFEANEQLYVIGKNAFAGCTALKEMFLTTFCNKVTNVTDACPWGFNGSSLAPANELSIFGSSSVFTDLVIYIDDPLGPPSGNRTVANPQKWNQVAATYPNQFSTSSIALVPTHAGVVRSDVKYYDLSSAAATTPYEDSVDFTSPCVAFVKNTPSDYTITRCYAGSSNVQKIDMSKFAEASNIKTIGYGAFAQMEGNGLYSPGREIVLPSSVTTIEDRAFYRASAASENNKGVNIITYKDGTEQTIAGKTNYCILPPSVTSIGRLAFYNNCFESVYIKGNLSYLGNTAFSVFPYEGDTPKSRASIDSITLGDTQSKFGVFATYGGLYYTGESGNRKTLIYQPASFSDGDNATDDDELRVYGGTNSDSGTLAIGARACANTNYTSVLIPDSLTTIYGGAFNRCLNLGTVSFGSTPGLKYIGAKAYNEDDVWTGNTANAATTMNDNPGTSTITFDDYYGAFYKSGVTTLDFTKLTNLVKIGAGAFRDCANLSDMTGGEEYTYYKWENGSLQPFGDNTTAIDTGVLDLSGCSNLRAIGREAFSGCTSLRFAHLPDNYKPAENKALYLGSGEPELEGDYSFDAEVDPCVFQGCTGLRVLVGETCATASYSVDYALATPRYPKFTFNDTAGVYAYYQVKSDQDLYEDGVTHYWYKLYEDRNEFLLLDDYANAMDFFGSEFYGNLQTSN